jgi:predicted ribosome quality control (RQC) complex YloA/Tae2 family protein
VFDALTMRAVADELTATLLGGRVQRVGLADARTLVLEIFAHGVRQHLLISDHPQSARVHLVPARLTADAERVTPFLLLLRKHVRGGRIAAIAQPALERTLAVSIVKAYPLVKDNTPVAPYAEAVPDTPDEPDDEETTEPDALPPGWVLDETTLIVEIMGRHSNVVLVDREGEILDALKRVPPATSRVRPILPHLPYAPPPQEKADPRTMTPAQLQHLCLLATEQTPLPTALVGSLRGVSPQIAREIAYRATGAANPPATACDPQRLNTALHDVLAPLATGAWQPRLYLRDSATTAFSPIPLRLFEDDPEIAVEDDPSISAIVARFHAAEDRAVAHGERRSRLVHAIYDAAERIDTRLRALRGELERAEAAELLRRRGEAIYAYTWMIAPGQRMLTTDDGLEIALDPGMSPSENAQEYFEQYRKAQRASQGLPERIAQAETERAYLGQMAALAETATAFDDLVTLENEWRDYSGGATKQPNGKPNRKPQRGAGSRRPRAYVTPEGHRILIGRSGPQNEQVTFALSRPEDMWLHARGVGGAHVIVQWQGGAVDPRTLERAAQLAAWYSSAREAGAVEVDYAPRRQVRKIAGAGPGMVTYRNERTIRVPPTSVEEMSARGFLRPASAR